MPGYFPDFERLRQTLFNKDAGTVPLIELGIDPGVKAAILGHPLKTPQDDIEFMRLMGYDFIKIQPKFNLPLNRQQLSGQSQRLWSSEHSGLVTNMQEFENYPWPKTEDTDYAAFEAASKVLPDDMGIIGQYGDIFTNVWEMMGFETFALAIYENPELVQLLFDRIGNLIVSMFEIMAEMEWVGALWYSDDIAYVSGPMINPDLLKIYFFPVLRRIGALAAAYNKPFIYHTDGDIRSIMSEIIECSVTALHPIEPKAMDISEIKNTFGHQLCLCGGIEVDMLARGSSDEIIGMTKKMIREIGKGGGYCLGSSNSIPDYVNIHNYKLMVETALKER
jgi:uroporphyrinogen decarboxylase